MSRFLIRPSGIFLLVAGVLVAGSIQAMQDSPASNSADASKPADPSKPGDPLKPVDPSKPAASKPTPPTTPVFPYKTAPVANDVVVLQARPTNESIEQLRDEHQALEQQCIELAAELRSDPSGRVPNQQKLVDLVLRTFNSRQQLQLAQLASSARRLERIQQSVATREAMKTEIVQRRVEELLATKSDDVKVPESKIADRETAELRIFEIVGSDPDLAFRILSQRLAGEADVRMELDKNKLVVQARPSIHKQITQLLDLLSSRGPKLEAIDLKRLDVEFAIATIKKFYGMTDTGTVDSAQPVIDGDMINRRLLIKGSPSQIAQVKSLVETLEINSGESDSSPRASISSTDANNSAPQQMLVPSTKSATFDLNTSGAGVSASDLLRTTPAEMRKLLYDKAIAVNSVHKSWNEIVSTVEKEGETEFLAGQREQTQKALKFKEGELRFALLQYDQILGYLQFALSDVQRKIAAATDDYRRKELLFQRGSLSQAELLDANEKTHAFDVDRQQIESLLKLYEAAGDLPDIVEARQKVQEKKEKN